MARGSAHGGDKKEKIIKTKSHKTREEKSKKILNKTKTTSKKREKAAKEDQATTTTACLDNDKRDRVFPQELEFSWAGVPELALEYDLCATGPTFELALQEGDNSADIGRYVL